MRELNSWFGKKEIALLLLVLAASAPSFAQSGTWGQPQDIKGDAAPELRPAQSVPAKADNDAPKAESQPTATTFVEKTTTVRAVKKAKVRKDSWIAYKLVNDPWFYKTAQEQPALVAKVCAHPGPARLLARSWHVGDVADADHYLCRRLTRWRGATKALVLNPHCGHVIAMDPEGIYMAINRDPKIGRLLAKNIVFNEMVAENPALGKLISKHM